MGLKVTDVRYMTDEEQQDMGWYEKCVVIHFNDGTIIYCSSDDEGNAAGALFYQTPRAEKVKEFQNCNHLLKESMLVEVFPLLTTTL